MINSVNANKLRSLSSLELNVNNKSRELGIDLLRGGSFSKEYVENKNQSRMPASPKRY